MKIKVNNMTNRGGNAAANQFIIETPQFYIFQSYDSIIAKKERGFQGKVILDPYYWDYSRTTLKYLRDFIGVNLSKKEIQSYIDQGIYKTRNLNK